MATVDASPAATGMRDRVRQAFSDFPGRTAILTERGSRTVDEVRQRVWKIAGLLEEAAGVPLGGQPVGFVLTARPDDFYDMRLATFENGAALFTLAPFLAPEALGAMLRSVAPRVVVYDANLLPHFPRLLAEALPGSRAIACAGGKDDWEDALAGIPLRECEAEVRPESLAGIGFTSGATGPPRGITATHAASAESCRMFLEILGRLGTRPGDALYLGVPIFGAGAGMIVPALSAGVALHVPARWDPTVALREIERLRIRYAFLTPSMIVDLLDQPLERHDLSALEAVVYGSSPIPGARLAEAVRRLRVAFLQGYGMAECLPPVTVLWPEDHGTPEQPADPEILSSAGRPYPGVRVRIDSADPTRPGEILMASPTITAGYWNDPDRTAAAREGEFFRSGDVGFIDDAGRLHVVDRQTDLIERHGRTLFPRQIEEVLAQHAAVKESSVVAEPASDRVVAAVSLRPSFRSEADSVRRSLAGFLEARLPREDLPDEIRVFDELPRGAQGKVSKQGVRDALRTVRR
jgi:fatty-acyl-CoA synthase